VKIFKHFVPSVIGSVMDYPFLVLH